MALTDENLAAAAAENQYLRGNFAPLRSEGHADDLRVEGTIPDGLDGHLLRTTPNPAGAVGPTHHWFLGDGMTHGIELCDGRAVGHRWSWVRTPGVEAATGLAAAPLIDPAARGNGNVNVIGHAGRILALSEVGLPWQLTTDTATVGQWDFDGALQPAWNVTAHPKIDPVTGELLFFGYDFGPTTLRYHRADADGTLVQTEDIATEGPTMMHDFNITETRVVFMDLPVVFDLNLLVDGMTMPFRWDDDYGARLGVMPRTGGSDDVQWIEIDPCYVFHPFNAYDDGDRIVVDVARYDRMFATSRIGPEEPRAARWFRWTIDPGSGTVREEQRGDESIEFPRIDDRFIGRRHRIGWAGRMKEGFVTEALLRYDLDAGTTQTWDPGPDRSLSEAVHVPARPDAPEGDGWLLAPVFDRTTERSAVVILDAADLPAGPVATVHLTTRIPFGFHGNWIPAT